MQGIILFDYIKNHLDAKGCFTEKHLPDSTDQWSPKLLGSEDAYSYAVDASIDNEGAQKTAALLRQYAALPCLETKRCLSDQLNAINVSRMADSFLEIFTAEELTEDILNLAEDYFYHSTQREPVKFAYLLFGLYGMEHLQQEEEELWQDLLTMAHCEEFTFHFIYGCRITNFTPEKELWELLLCTHGWGKIYALNAISFTTDEQRQWLIENGCDLEAEYPPLSVRMITESRLLEALNEPQISHAYFKGALAILNNFLILINTFDIATLNQNFNTSSIDLDQLLTQLLHHAEAYQGHPADVLDLVALDLGLKNSAENENWYKLSPNQCHTLIAACEKLIFSRDWQSYINKHLLDEQGQLDYILCDLAFELSLYIWTQLEDYFYQHPLEIKLLPYLLAYDGPERAAKIILYMEKHINDYLLEPSAFITPLRYLLAHPGEGVSLITVALVSLYDWPRCMACLTLEAWGEQYLTPALLSALHTAAGLAQSPFAQACTKKLLMKQEQNTL